MKNIKRLISIVLTVAMLSTVFSVCSFAQEEWEAKISPELKGYLQTHSGESVISDVYLSIPYDNDTIKAMAYESLGYPADGTGYSDITPEELEEAKQFFIDTRSHVPGNTPEEQEAFLNEYCTNRLIKIKSTRLTGACNKIIEDYFKQLFEEYDLPESREIPFDFLGEELRFISYGYNMKRVVSLSLSEVERLAQCPAVTLIEKYVPAKLSPTAVYDRESKVMGDANGDYKVDAVDALMILQYSIMAISGKDILVSNSVLTKTAATPTSVDALLALQYSIKIISMFPVQYPEIQYEDWTQETEKDYYVRGNCAPDAVIISNPEDCPKEAYDLLGIDESFFDENCLVTFRIYSETNGHKILINDIYLTNENTLRVDYDYVYKFLATSVESRRQYFVKINGKLDQVSNVDVQMVDYYQMTK